MRYWTVTVLLTLFTLSLINAQTVDDDRAPFTIKLDPIADINPVKTQHTIIATVLDKKGRPLPGQRVEWILARGPKAVGDIVEHDDMGAIVGNKKVEKISNQYTVTYTNERPVLLTMGTPTPDDDIKLEVGQTWITITSPFEGETHIIAFCPNIRNANRHKAFAVKYWVDAKIIWPKNGIDKVGTYHKFKFKLIKASTNAPITGYIVKWILEKEGPKGYFGENKNTRVVDSKTDEEGESSVTLRQIVPKEGVNTITIELRKPTGELLAIRKVREQWIAPKITIKKTGPAEGILGEKVVYTIELSNPGDTEANEVRIEDKLPLGLSYLDCTFPPTKIKGRKIIWNIGKFAKDAHKKFVLTLKAVKVGTWANTVKVYSKEAPPQVSTAITKIGAPKLYIIKEGPSEIRKDKWALYTLTLKNTGNAVAKRVVIKDWIPAGMQFKNRKDGFVLKWKVGRLLPGKTKVFKYKLKAIKTGKFVNSAKVYMKGKLVHKSVFSTRVVAPLLKLKKTGERLVFLDKPTTYTITVSNEGDADAKDMVLIDTLPNYLDYISSKPRGIFKPHKGEKLAKVIWKLGNIPPKKKVVIKIQVRPNTIGTCKNAVKLISKSTEPPILKPLESYFNTTIIGVPAMHINSYDTEDPVEVGKQTIYVIEVRNEGTSPCTNVRLENHIDEEMEFISANGPTPFKVSKDGKKVIFDPVPILKPAEKLTYRIVCKAIKEGSAKNTATLRYDQFKKPIIDEEGTSIYK